MTFKPEKTLNTKLADSLKRVKDAATKEIVQSSNISRIDRERLIRHGYLHKIIKGWYFLARFYGKGESIAWYACYWDFLSLYLPSRFNEKYCLSAESSLKVYTASNTIPKQIIVITETGGQSRHDLPHDTSIFLYADKKTYQTRRQLLTD